MPIIPFDQTAPTTSAIIKTSTTGITTTAESYSNNDEMFHESNRHVAQSQIRLKPAGWKNQLPNSKLRILLMTQHRSGKGLKSILENYFTKSAMNNLRL